MVYVQVNMILPISYVHIINSLRVNMVGVKR